uniref:Uncharacterized protein n=1 Tax=Eutreptiella gymnastica TaxID=73025 RepID=A0A6T2K2D9_9EUGL|mmetsp:Transcript_100059/g.168965  ORF Transcript_100059/g.168965 Transcript_100059/m.168965 type:complete len:102 (-) Transcript_100059:463-768(-)
MRRQCGCSFGLTHKGTNVEKGPTEDEYARNWSEKGCVQNLFSQHNYTPRKPQFRAKPLHHNKPFEKRWSGCKAVVNAMVAVGMHWPPSVGVWGRRIASDVL